MGFTTGTGSPSQILKIEGGGDVYFKIHRENHNLDRCRTQFKMVADMEEKHDQMASILDKYR